jgi:hypothetical protein
LTADEQISKNRSISKMKNKRNMTPQKVSNHTTKDLINTEGAEASIFEFK